ncbi:aminotransferase class IV [Candidatus Omnitrophota bacterium]
MRIYLNGNIKGSKLTDDILEPGFLFGWGVFETLRIYRGKPVFLKDHIQRLKVGCEKILLRFPAVAFGKKIAILLRVNKLSDAHCRITIFKKKNEAGVLISVTPLVQYSKSSYRNGFKAAVASFTRSSRDFLIGVKSTSYLENMIVRKTAEDRGKQEAIFLNESGFLTEGSRSNLFFVKGKTVYTPSLECGLLNGITRQKVIKIIKNNKLRLRLGRFKLGDLLSCDEAFFTSSLMEIMPLVEVDGESIKNGKPGEITRSLHRAYKLMINHRKFG